MTMLGAGDPSNSSMVRMLRRPKVQSVASQAAYVVSITALNVVVVRGWGTEIRGELATITVAATVLATAGGLGLTDVLVWAEGQVEADLDVSARFRRSLLSVAIAGAAAALLVVALLDDPVGWLVLPWTLSLHLFRASMSTRLADGDFGRFNRDRTAFPLVSTAVVLVGAVSAAAHPALLVLVGQLVAVGLLFDRQAPQLRLSGPLRGHSPGEAGVAKNSVVGNLAGLSLARIDVLIVAAILGAEDAGIYAVALAIGDGAMVASHGLMFHAMHEGATERRVNRRTLAASIGSSALLSLVAVTILAIGGERVLGSDFEDLWLTFALLVPGITAMGFVRLRYAGDLTSGLGGRATAALLVSIGFLVTLDLALVPAQGIDGAALSSSIAYIVAALMLVRRRVDDRVVPAHTSVA